MKRREVAEKTRTVYQAARYASVGIEIGVSIIIGMGGGWWIDSEFDTGPWGLLIGFCFGTAAAIRSLMKTYGMIMKDHVVSDDDELEEKDNGHSE